MNETAHTATPESQPVLWCANILGPDDIVAAGSYLEAVRMAHAFNAWWLDYRAVTPLHEQYDARMWSVPIEWPHSAASHAESLATPSDEYDWLRAAISKATAPTA